MDRAKDLALEQTSLCCALAELIDATVDLCKLLKTV